MNRGSYIGTLAHTIVSRVLLIVVILIILIPMIICLLVPARWRYDNPVLLWVFCFFYKASLLVTFLPIKVIGGHLIPQEPAVVVANHQSSLDIPLVGQLLRCHPHVWLATYELMDSWLLRFILPRLVVLIDMRTPMKGMRSLIKAIKMIQEKKRHAVLFPEGERFADDKIHDFFGGFVILAKKTGRPVVPVRIFGACNAYPRGSFLIHWTPITVVVGEPMYMQPDESDAAFKKRVHAWFVAQKVT